MDYFTIDDKYELLYSSILILIFSVGLFVRLESLNEAKKGQIKSKKIIILYIFLVIILLVASFNFVVKPYVDDRTMKVETRLCEVLFDHENKQIELKPIEDAYYPTFDGKNISWYSVDFKDQRYLQFEEIDIIHMKYQVKMYKVTNDSRNLTITEGKGPIEVRGIEIQSFWYSLILVFYNILIAIIIYPLFSVYNAQVRLLWKSQNIISLIVLSIMTIYAFMF